MKVLFIAPIPHPSQKNAHPAPWIISLIDELKKKKLEIQVLNYSHLCKKSIEEYWINGVKYVFLRSLHPKIDLFNLYLFRIIRINKYIRKLKSRIDLIHIFGNEHQYEILFPRLKGIPLIIHIQGIISEYRYYYPQSGLKKLIWYLTSFYEKIGYRLNSNYSCRTFWDKKIIKFHNPNAKVFQIWEMIRSDFFQYKIQKKGNNILFIGGSNPIKGLNNALVVFDKIKHIGAIKLIIIGNTSINFLHNAILQNNLTIELKKDVQVLGFQDSTGIINAYKQSFCLLHPSLIDNSPNSICEAQICGLPVVASNVGGVSSLIDDGVTGFLTSSKADDIAKRVLQLYTNDKLWDSISIASQNIARERHLPLTIVNQTLEMYKEVINNYDS